MRFQIFLAFVATRAALAAPTVWLAGDSTMAATGANDGDTAGWGAYLTNYISLTVVNDAIGGRSARSFTREGRFTAMAPSVQAGDFVIIEFGHNDGGSLSTDNGRTDCGVGDAGYATTCTTVYNGVTETVLTYEAYLVNAAKLFTARGANVIISSPTPNNPWESGTFSYSPSRFTTYSQDAATEAGGIFVDHGLYTAALYNKAGATVVDSYYPNDHTHTSPAGANVVARAFILALEATSSGLKSYITHD
ncbi:Rhamnogalacturonan Acetylesterase [Mucidula mucida]|nr:Rhamnogalacturonan Acetylesterase [Mucidula mucida]